MWGLLHTLRSNGEGADAEGWKAMDGKAGLELKEATAGDAALVPIATEAAVLAGVDVSGLYTGPATAT